MVQRRLVISVLLSCLVLPVFSAAQDAPRENRDGGPAARRKRLLAIGDGQTYGYQHESVSHALAVIERLGRESGVYDTVIRTDTQLLTKQPVTVAIGAAKNVKNLNDFDAVFFYTAGSPVMSEQQKSDLLSFIKDDGKGFTADSEVDGQGLRSMSRRAKSLGGSLTIESNAENGTLVKFDLVLVKNSRI